MRKRTGLNVILLLLLVLIFIPSSVFANGYTEYPEDMGLDGAVSEPDGLEVNILHLTTEYYGAYPAWGNWSWSSDGAKIVYQTEDFNDDGEICVINVDGTGFARLTDNDRCDSHASFVWPNNSKIVFQRNVESTGNGEIWIMDANGANQTSLTQAHGGPIRGAGTCENKPMVSPDGTKVAFRGCTNDKGNDWVQLYVMKIDGTGVVEVAGYDDGLTEFSHHCWSPDSQWIAFKTYEEDTTTKDDCGARIYKVKADGSGLIKLSPDPENLPDGWGDDYGMNWPQWSPDGKWIATSVCTNTDYNWKKLAIMDANGGNLQAVMEQDGDEDGDDFDCISPHFSWSPDSNWLVYVMDTVSVSASALCMSNIYSGTFYQLTEDYWDSQPRWSPAPNGKPGRILFKRTYDNRKEGGDGLSLLNLAPWALDEIIASGRANFAGCGATTWVDAGISLGVNLGEGSEHPFFIGALYDGNPTPQAFEGTYWDLYCPDPTNVVTVTLGMYFNGYTPGMSFYWFNEDINNWAALDPGMYEVGQGIYNMGCMTYTAAVTMTLTADTTPSLEQLTGTVFAAGTVPEDEANYWASKDNDFPNCFVKSLDTMKTSALPYGVIFLVLALCFAAFFKRALR